MIPRPATPVAPVGPSDPWAPSGPPSFTASRKLCAPMRVKFLIISLDPHLHADPVVLLKLVYNLKLVLPARRRLALIAGSAENRSRRAQAVPSRLHFARS